MADVDLSNKKSPHTLGNRIRRVVWGVGCALLFRPTPRIAYGWRRFVLRLFGAKIGTDVNIHRSVKIIMPWNLEIGDHVGIGHDVDLYCVAKFTIGSNVTISQYSYLCGATHDHLHPRFPLVPKPIAVGEGAWIAADAYIAPGVTIGEGAVVGARASVFKDVAPWTIVGGNPAKEIGKREMNAASA